MVNLKLYAWIVRGRQRTAILKAFDKPMTVSHAHRISKDYDEKISLENMCEVLRGFVEEGIAVCVDNKGETGRIYQLTNEGEEIRGELMGE